MAELIMELTGCGPLEASKALIEYKTIEDAVDALLTKPVVSGDKYIPTKPKVETGLTEEQEERCKKGRWLQDKVNAVFSVAHSKMQTPLGPSEQQSDDIPAAATAQKVLLPSIDESLPGADEKRTQSVPQSEMLQ